MRVLWVLSYLLSRGWLCPSLYLAVVWAWKKVTEEGLWLSLMLWCKKKKMKFILKGRKENAWRARDRRNPKRENTKTRRYIPPAKTAWALLIKAVTHTHMHLLITLVMCPKYFGSDRLVFSGAGIKSKIAPVPDGISSRRYQMFLHFLYDMSKWWWWRGQTCLFIH